MMNVLVVDDDKLVRQGLISAMPWADFDLRVVGEARNGEKALEFLESQPVDLLLTDLAMPVMSGLELMREVRSRYPHIYIVVLTLHQDFHYIQEALRLGAIDYIAKVQLEEEQFDQVLERICTRIRSERDKGAARGNADAAKDAALEPDTATGSLAHDTAYAVIGEAPEPILQRVLASDTVPGLRRPDRIYASVAALWLPRQDEQEDALEKTLTDLIRQDAALSLTRLSGAAGLRTEELGDRLQAYAREEWYYTRLPDRQVYDLALDELANADARQPDRDAREQALSAVRERGTGLEWVHDDTAFEQLQADLLAMRLSVPRLQSELIGWSHAWNRIYESVSGDRLAPPEPMSAWYEVRQWLTEMREQLRAVLGAQPYSPEVRACITRAAVLVQERLAEPLQAAQLAREVNMSRSYFSQCFRDLIGTTFNDYVRQQRIERAAALLVETRKTVQWVAEHVGYADDKYFSRIFREQKGMLPSEFRQQHAPKGTDVR
ncbi:response regulator [Paenibacillus sp. IB182496]|uniref:Response regulator n=1 Tax=Paenibacillus sabuli TaxID=2772509 RepID=A0A927GPV1_9BACL|nr:response regulator [Paenibacillus sabuli]MBD2843708.1 response regulator [Paenibacillus sabuli]